MIDPFAVGSNGNKRRCRSSFGRHSSEVRCQKLLKRQVCVCLCVCVCVCVCWFVFTPPFVAIFLMHISLKTQTTPPRSVGVEVVGGAHIYTNITAQEIQIKPPVRCPRGRRAHYFCVPAAAAAAAAGRALEAQPQKTTL